MRTACQYQLRPSLARPPPCRHPGCRPRRAATPGRRPRQRPRRRAAVGSTRPWCRPTPSTPLHSQRDLRWVHISPLATTLQVRREKGSFTNIQFIFELSSSQPYSVYVPTFKFSTKFCVRCPGGRPSQRLSPVAAETADKNSKVSFFSSIVTLNQSCGKIF